MFLKSLTRKGEEGTFDSSPLFLQEEAVCLIRCYYRLEELLFERKELAECLHWMGGRRGMAKIVLSLCLVYRHYLRVFFDPSLGFKVTELQGIKCHRIELQMGIQDVF